MDRIENQPTEGRLVAVRVLEGMLLALVVGSIGYAALDYWNTDSPFSLWLAVMVALLAFHPLIRRAFKGHPLTYLLQIVIGGLTVFTVVALFWQFRRTNDAWVFPLVMLLFAMVFWSETRFRILYGHWKQG
ncbi:hypothetical protein [uncultured Enterovirga sp.]|uniref:hypothetical protein n=1 Tax=uncultured Enterovirga sp. TaxID=2026352 RepID=UPI0035CAA717